MIRNRYLIFVPVPGICSRAPSNLSDESDKGAFFKEMIFGPHLTMGVATRRTNNVIRENFQSHALDLRGGERGWRLNSVTNDQ